MKSLIVTIIALIFSFASFGTVAPFSPSAASVNACTGGSVLLTDATSGGTWSSSNPGVASINITTGELTFVSAGTATITYSVPGSYTTGIFTVNPTPAPITGGVDSMCAGTFVVWYHDTTGHDSVGTWDINPTSVAVFESIPGVTGVSAGSATLTYTIAGCSSYRTIYVNPCDGISGSISLAWGDLMYGGNGAIKVWLFGYDAGTSSYVPVDSTMSYGSFMTYYQFNGIPTGSYIVKAMVESDTTYIPTYYTSMFYWDSATVINHTAGVSQPEQDINMIVNPLPGGFWVTHTCSISGHVKTSTGVPVANLAIEVIGASIPAGPPIFLVYTDASGRYSIDSLPSDTYSIFPDSLNYITTPYSNVVVDSANPIAVNIDLTQYTTGTRIITPNLEAVASVAAGISSVLVFPSPTTGKLNIQWKEKAAEAGSIRINDATGREVYRSVLAMGEGTGRTTLDLSTLINGIYIVSVKSPSLNYYNKIEIQH